MRERSGCGHVGAVGELPGCGPARERRGVPMRGGREAVEMPFYAGTAVSENAAREQKLRKCGRMREQRRVRTMRESEYAIVCENSGVLEC